MSWIKAISIDDMLHYAVDYYNFVYEDDSAPTICTFSPASAYIFGEHADYNRGYAMAVTLPLPLMVLVGFNKKKVINIATEANCGLKILESYPLKNFEVQIKDAPTWAKITLWAVHAYKDKINEGINVAYVSSIPMRIGLGSSTAMTTAIFSAMECLARTFLRERRKIRMCRDIELYGTNTPTGFAQPTINFCAEMGYALLMDCRTLTGNYLPIKNLPVLFVITDSGIERKVSETPLKQRLEECEKAASLLGVKNLAEATSDLLHAKKGAINLTLYKRAKHVVEEAIRIFEAGKALKRKDYHTFGLMMLKSHYSLKDNFEVSCKHIDDLVALAMACPGVYGSKLSGIGFGGCTITLVEREHFKQFVQLVDNNYVGECRFLPVQAWGSTTEMSFDLKDYTYNEGLFEEVSLDIGNLHESTMSAKSFSYDDSINGE